MKKDLLIYEILNDGTCAIYANHFFVCNTKNEDEAKIFIKNWES